jgi:hypothetical protein
MQVGKFNEGTAYFSRASEAAPDVASIRMQQALGSLAQGQSDAAVGQLESAISLDPEARQATVLLALVKNCANGTLTVRLSPPDVCRSR